MCVQMESLAKLGDIDYCQDADLKKLSSFGLIEERVECQGSIDVRIKETFSEFFKFAHSVNACIKIVSVFTEICVEELVVSFHSLFVGENFEVALKSFFKSTDGSGKLGFVL